MIDTKALRQKILDLAFQGKLTEQLPEDGTGEELFQQIQQEKQKLEAEGKIKKNKPLSPIDEAEIPFEIPKSWEWVHLGELFDHNTGKALNSNNNDGKLLTYITTSNVYWDSFVLDSLKKMCFSDAEIEKCSVKKGDLLVCEGGDIGRAAIWTFDEEIRIQNHLHRLRRYFELIETKFYYYVLRYYKQIGLISGVGIGLQGFSSNRVHFLAVPLPSYMEQKRIVEKIDKAFEMLMSIEELSDKYGKDNSILKSKLIDAAIQGKLTEQLPEDGTAEELYQQIQQEKLELEKAGKIKKSKPLPPISEEERPFDIPDNWKWVRWGVLSEQIQYGHIASAKEFGNIKMVRISDIQDNKVDWANVPYCDIDDESIEAYLLHNNDVLFARTGGTVGKSYLVENITEKAVFAGYLIRSSYSDKLNAKFIKLFMDSSLYWKQLQNGTTATAQPNCNGQTLSKMILPLPPLAEQKRIVAKLEELLPLCE